MAQSLLLLQVNFFLHLAKNKQQNHQDVFGECLVSLTCLKLILHSTKWYSRDTEASCSLLTVTRGYSLAGRRSARFCLTNSSATKASLRPGKRFSYSVGSARDSAAFWLTLERFSRHSLTTLEKQTVVTHSWFWQHCSCSACALGLPWDLAWQIGPCKKSSFWETPCFDQQLQTRIEPERFRWDFSQCI